MSEQANNDLYNPDGRGREVTTGLNAKTTVSLPLLVFIQAVIGAGGMFASWGMVKSDMQNLSMKVITLERKQEDAQRQQAEISERLARIETKIEMVLNEQRKIKKELY